MKEILLLLVMFWNVENYFDTYDNPVTSDEEFTPSGDNRWSWKRFEKKRDDIAKTILNGIDKSGADDNVDQGTPVFEIIVKVINLIPSNLLTATAAALLLIVPTPIAPIL